MKIKNICPVIGIISSGKSSVLNALFNMDCLEAKPEVTTKIVTIIRYNSLINEPRFFHLVLKNDGNGNYTFYKDNDKNVITGKKNIMEEINLRNEEWQKKEPKYEEIFFMLEVCEVNFIEKEFLKNNDFADVPGVSENMANKKKNSSENKSEPNENNNSEEITVEEQVKNIDIEKEINYVTQIFKIMKNKMNTGIFIFSANNYYLIENYKIIGILQNILGRPIENFLLLLNKMDTSDTIDEDIKSLNEKLLQHFPNGLFNVTRNTIVKCSSFQLENELKMGTEFNNLLYYHYINYIMDSSKNYGDFIDYFKGLIQQYIKKDAQVENIKEEEFINNIESIKDDEYIKKIPDIIKRIKYNHDKVKKTKLLLDEDDFNADKIKKCLDDLVSENDNVNLADQTNNTLIILYYYYLFKNKKIVSFRSTETNTIMEFFTMQNMNKNFNYKKVESKLQELENKDSYSKKVNDVIEEINKFYEKYKEGGINLNQNDNVENSFKPIINNLKTSKFFYIPVVGLYNAGKSTILNDIIGYNLLPVKKNECTKRGILIAHWDNDYPIIRKAEFVTENIGNKNDICYCSFNNTILAEGEKNVRKILEGVNGNFIDREKDFFYLINVKIKFLEHFHNDTIKENICFVDLPGYGTKNKFETKNIYSKFIKNCKIILLVARDHISGEEEIEKINDLLSKISEYQGISISALCKKILFIINNSQNSDISEKSLLNHKSKLIKNITSLEKDKIIQDINITFFNGGFYEYYLENKYYFTNLEHMFESRKEEHLIKLEKLRKGYLTSCDNKFESYLVNDIKNNLKSIFNMNPSDVDEKTTDQESSEVIDAIIKKKNYKFKPKELKDIKKIIAYCRQNIEQCKELNLSNFLNFSFYLIATITNCKHDSVDEFKNLIEDKLSDLDTIFHSQEYFIKLPEQKEISYYFKEKLDAFNKDIDNSKDVILRIIKNDYDIPHILEKCIDSIKSVLNNLKNEIQSNLKQKKSWKDIQREFETTFKSTVEDKKKNIVENLEKCSDEIKTNYLKSFEIINQFKTNSKEEHKFKELKIYLSNKLGEKNNYKEAFDNIVTDIVSNSRTATDWKNSSGFFDYLKSKFFDEAYLNKTIDYIISNSSKRLESFRKNISNLIDEYKVDIITKIDIEKNNISNFLQKEVEKEELANKNNKKLNEVYEAKKKENEKSKEKWNEICEKYNEVKTKIKNILKNSNISESQLIIYEEGETPNP